MSIHTDGRIRETLTLALPLDATAEQIDARVAELRADIPAGAEFVRLLRPQDCNALTRCTWRGAQNEIRVLQHHHYRFGTVGRVDVAFYRKRTAA